MRSTSKQQELKPNFDSLGDLPIVTQEISCWARKETQCFNLIFWCHFDDKVPKTKSTGFTNAANGRTPCPDGALGITYYICLFAPLAVFEMVLIILQVSSTEHQISEQAVRVAGESRETAWLVICVVISSTQVEFSCKDLLPRKCSPQF